MGVEFWTNWTLRILLAGWVIAALVLPLVPTKSKESKWARINRALERSLVPLGLLLIIQMVLLLPQLNGNVKSLLDASARTTEFHDIETFFRDLEKATLNPSTKFSLVTLIRFQSDSDYASSTVSSYYDSAVQRCEKDRSFTLRRVLGVTTEPLLELARKYADASSRIPNFEFRVFRWQQKHTPVNLVILGDDIGPHTVYVIVTPSTRSDLRVMKLEGSRSAARVFEQYHRTLYESADVASEDVLTEIQESLRQTE